MTGVSSYAMLMFHSTARGGAGMYKDERDVFYYDAATHIWHRKYAGLPSFPHRYIAQILRYLHQSGKAEVVKKSTLQAIYITSIDLYSDRCEMLIGYSDTNAADPTFNDHPAKKRRVVTKEGNEGLEHSAHVVWYYKDQANNKPCEFYLEGAIGLSSSAVVRFVNKLLREFCKRHPDSCSVPDPSGEKNADGTFKQIRVRPRLELRGHPSAEFIRDLKAGEVSEVELITESKAANVWDANGYAVEEHRGVLLKPAKKLIPKAKDFLDGIFSANVKNEYEKSRVVFKTAGNIKKNVTFYTKNYQLVNDLKYVKKSRIKGFGGKLPNAFSAIYIPIIQEIRNIISSGNKQLSSTKI